MAEFMDVTHAHAPVLSAIHERAFDSAWSVASFQTLLASPGVFALMALDPPDQPAGLIMIRQTADEAEVLTLCTDPEHRRKGLGRALLSKALDRLGSAPARCFVEVADDNLAARALYESFGCKTVGRRTGYYETDRGRVDALIMVLERENGNQLQIA